MKTLLISMSIIIILGIVVFFYLFNDINAAENDDEQTIEDMNKFSYETPEMTTDLKNGAFVRIQFLVVTDGKKAAVEIEEREFQIQNMLIKELAVMSESDFREGLSNLESSLQDELNEVMTEGKITDVYTINKILQ